MNLSFAIRTTDFADDQSLERLLGFTRVVNPRYLLTV